MDPAVTDERDPVAADPALDMFNPDNGPPYGAAFLARYRAAPPEVREAPDAATLEELIRRYEEEGGEPPAFAGGGRVFAPPAF
jgi:hypothetical protein